MDDEQERRESTAQRVGQDLGVGVRNLASGLFSSTPVKEEEGGDDLSDLFEVPQEDDNDMQTDDLLEVDEEEGVEDLLTVSQEDVMYGAGKSKPKPKLVRTDKPYPFSLTGMR